MASDRKRLCAISRLPSPAFSRYEARRVELAEAALETPGELGYAKTSLREIAQKSDFTHAVLHYYFSDKLDLICCSIRHFKARCITRYDMVTAEAQTCEQLMEGFLEKLAETIRDEQQMHCLCSRRSRPAWPTRYSTVCFRSICCVMSRRIPMRFNACSTKYVSCFRS